MKLSYSSQQYHHYALKVLHVPFLLAILLIVPTCNGTSSRSSSRSSRSSYVNTHHHQASTSTSTSTLPQRSFHQLTFLSNIHLLRGGSSNENDNDNEIINFDETVTPTTTPTANENDHDGIDLQSEVQQQSQQLTSPPSSPTEDSYTDTSTETVTTTTTPTVAVAESVSVSVSIAERFRQNPKLQNAIERTGPALLMLFHLYIFVKFTGEKGLIFFLIPLLQFGMYKETTGIIEEHYNNNNNNNTPIVTATATTTIKKHNFDLGVHIEKWWWFVTVFIATTGRSILNSSTTIAALPSILSFLKNKETVNLICFGMVSIGLVMAVAGMASHVDASADRFRSYLGEVASFHFALIFLIGQSSFWIKTIQSFGIAWLLYPALLVVVNDTMAYVFGVLFGNHKLLPKLSPKKTVEGFLGAAVSTIGISIPLLKFFVSYLSKKGTSGSSSGACYEKFGSVLLLSDDGGSNGGLVKHAIVMALYTSLISPFGGFLASAVKRAHGAKDFGSLIPGHGGVVDRFDCQVVTAPFVYLYLKWCLSGNN